MNIVAASLCAWLLLILLPNACMADGQAPNLDVMIGQMIMVGFRGTELSDSNPIIRDIEQVGVGGVILFDRDVVLGSRERNIESPEQVRNLNASLQKRAAMPLLIALDQEGGRVSRLKPDRGFPGSFSARHLGDKNDLKLTFEAGQGVGRTMRELGFNLDFAPVLDVDVNQDSPAIGRLERSFSPDPDNVAAHARAFIDGLHSAGILACAKHFPGHGSSNHDSHQGLTDITKTWNECELVPYQILIPEGRLDMVMVGHLFNEKLDRKLPATLSTPTVKGLLRGKLGYTGPVVTDDLQMRAITDTYSLEDTVRKALGADVDILLFGNNLAYDPDVAPKTAAIIKDLVIRGKVPWTRIAASYERIMELKRRLIGTETAAR